MIFGAAQVRCPVCGEPHSACGPPTDTIGVDERIEESPGMQPVKTYTVTINGVKRRLQLSEADAERLGAEPEGETKQAEPETKQHTPQNKSAKKLPGGTSRDAD